MIYIDDQVKTIHLNLVRSIARSGGIRMKTLQPLIEYGASPRASIFLGLGLSAMAFLQGRGYVTPQDVKDIAYDVLRHRVIPHLRSRSRTVASEDVIKTILTTVPVP